MKKYVIGIDVGGTNTDGVLTLNKTLIAKCKVPTQLEIEKGVVEALKKLLPFVDGEIQHINVGTTHATNAILQESDELLEVGLIRIAGHVPALPPAYTFASSLKKKVLKGSLTIPGGYTCDGKPITPFSLSSAEEAVEKLLDDGAKAIAIVGTFSCLNPDQEESVASLVKGVPVTISSKLGGIGFIPRENASILNASLYAIISEAFGLLEQAIRAIGIQAPLYMVNNDGSMMRMEEAIQFPLLTISAGQTNSFIGASRLHKKENCLILDIGGTSTDIGVVENGLPKKSTRESSFGGVSLQFSIPDVASLSIGGGTIIQNGVLINQSVAKDLMLRSQCFRGSTLTLTDLALQEGVMEIEGANLDLIHCTHSERAALFSSIQKKLEYTLSLLRSKEKSVPLLAVGGAACLLEHLMPEIMVPEHAEVANAYGASLATVSSTIDLVTSLQDREKRLDELQDMVKTAAIQKGADSDSVRISSLSILPIPYAKEALARITITATGESV